MTRRLLRTLVPLAVLLAAAVAVILYLRGSAGTPERLLGGRLVDLDPTTIEQIVVVVEGRQHNLTRGEGTRWSLRGAVHDWVDPVRLAYRLAELDGALGGPVIAGSEPEDRRYEFTGPDAVRLTMRAEDGREFRLALGATNPVTGLVYASGAGRPGCFPVQREVRDLLAGLVASVRVQTILPEFPLERLQAIELRWGEQPARLERNGGRWWLRVDSLADPLLPPLARDYQQHYADRRREDAGGLWVQAARGGIDLLVDDVSAPPLRALAPLGQTEVAWSAWGLEEIWRRVTLIGPGLDPDLLADDPDRMTIAFGQPLDSESIGATRRDLPLLAGKTPAMSLEKPLRELVDVRAFTRRIVDADTVVVANASRVLMRAAHDRTVPVRFDGREAWSATPPLVGATEGADPHDAARFMVIDLDRLLCAAVLPPVQDPAVLAQDERLRLTIVWNDPPHREVYHAGVLDPSRVPGGAAALVPAPANPGPVGLWRPADGYLLQIPEGLVITGRNLAR